MTISIILPTLNRADLVLDCLSSLKETINVSHEVIVVDDGSTPGNKVAFQSFTAGLIDKLITNKENMGTSYSMNVGLKVAEGDYTCIINNDIVFAPDWDNPLLNVLSDEIWVSSPVITEGRIPRTFPNVPLEKKMINFLPIQGCLLMTKRSLWDEIGYFPKDLRLWYCDNWLSDTVLSKGKRCVFVQDSYVHHFRSQTANETVIPNLAEIVEKDKQTYYAKYAPTK